jgi:tRNA1(Val) A37 N6-methylase TrmN6
LTEDGFLGGRLKILQPEKGYRAGIDPVFLAASIPCKPGEPVFEAGIGTGVAALCLVERVPSVHVTGIELASRYAYLAEENARRNNLDRSIHIIHGDVKDALRRDLAHMPEQGSFAHAYANPPYFEHDKATPSPAALKATAHTFAPEDLELWVKVLFAMIIPSGTVTFIHRAESLGQLLAAMAGRFGDIRVAPLHPREGAAASRIIVQGVKGSKSPMQLLRGLVLHGTNAKFTAEAEAILRNGLAWQLR